MKKAYSFLLYSTLLLFLIKGIQYAFLGSYVPLILSLVVILIAFIIRNSKKKASVAIKFWSILMIAWSLLRICIGLMDFYGKELTENHIQENMAVFGYINSVLFLFVGLYLIKKRKSWLQERI